MQRRKLAVLCSGQAGQRLSLLDGIMSDPAHRELLDSASALLGTDCEKWWRGLTENELYTNANAQFAIVLYQLATWNCIGRLLPSPSLIAGYSVGELVACCLAGALNQQDTLRLALARAELMDQAAARMQPESGAMMLWRRDTHPDRCALRDQMMRELGIDCAIVRSADELALSGQASAIDALLARFKPENPDLVRIPVTIPSHSRYMTPAVEPLHRYLLASGCGAPVLPLLSGITARPITTRAELAALLSEQLNRTVHWDRCMAAIAQAGVDTVIELGPGMDLTRLLKRAYPEINVCSVDEFPRICHFHDWLYNQTQQGDMV